MLKRELAAFFLFLLSQANHLCLPLSPVIQAENLKQPCPQLSLTTITQSLPESWFIYLVYLLPGISTTLITFCLDFCKSLVGVCLSLLPLFYILCQIHLALTQFLRMALNHLLRCPTVHTPSDRGLPQCGTYQHPPDESFPTQHSSNVPGGT